MKLLLGSILVSSKRIGESKLVVLIITRAIAMMMNFNASRLNIRSKHLFLDFKVLTGPAVGKVPHISIALEIILLLELQNSA